ncbi:MAG: FHA domain-containing protein [Thermoanaerobaculaceae bacterium]|nr:FHA domain-containing protein [Thermoanaerobaculaceae bacterium]
MRELIPFPMGGPEAPQEPGAKAELDATVMIESPGGRPGEETGWRPSLEVITGSSARRVLSLGGERVTIGRADANDLVLADDRVSRTHAAIRFADEGYVIEDLDSSNGVRVDGRSVRTAVLRHGSRIALGASVLQFSNPVPEIPAADRVALLDSSDVLQALDATTKAAVAERLTARFVPRGAVILRQGTPMRGIVFLHRGRARVVEVNDEGGERTVAHVDSGESFGERGLVAGGAALQSLVAEVDSCVLELDKGAFDQLLAQTPDVNRSHVDTLRVKLQTAQVKAAGAGARRDDVDDIVTSADVEIIGEDKKILRAKDRIATLAQEGQPVLLVGPPGVGKRTLARHYHKVGPQPRLPYVELSVADAPQGAGAAIFGVESGQDAAGLQGQVGYLEMIGDGTLAITHAELLDAHQQALLAAYLKFGWFHRVFGQQSVKTKTRLIFLATGEEVDVLAKLTPELREILSPRTVVVPPLTQRLKDIPLLAEHFLKRYAAKAGRRGVGLSPEATDRLVSYAWPGNVTELENVVERAAIVATAEAIIPADLIFVAPPEKELHKLNLLRHEKVRALLRNPRLFATFIWIDIAVVALVTLFTLWGGSRPAGHPLQAFENNPGMLVTWLIWFPLLPITAFLVGRIWCGVCPIAGIGDLAARIKRYNLPVPKILKRLDFWLLIASFVAVDYIEELAGVADRPWATAVFLIAIVYLAVAFTVLYERKTFCRYLCPLGGLLGAYSTMSMAEVRGNKKVCQTQCGEHTCYKGSGTVAGCPLASYPASLATNADCMMCGNCVKSCENRGVQVNLRPPLQELWKNAQPTLALSLFAVILVGLMAKHQFPALTSWLSAQQRLGWSDPTAHTVLFVGFVFVAVAGFAAASTLAAAASQETVVRNMTVYGIALIPLAFAGHLAHVTHEFLGDGIYQIVGYSIKLYEAVFKGIAIGSREVVVTPFVNPGVLTFLKFLIVAGGFVGSLVALVMIARRVSERNVLARALPHIVLLLVFWIAYEAIFTGATGAPPAATGTPVAAAPIASPRPGAP